MSLLTRILVLVCVPFLLAGVLHMHQVDRLLRQLDSTIQERLRDKAQRIQVDVLEAMLEVDTMATRLGHQADLSDAVEILDTDYLYQRGRVLIGNGIDYITFVDREGFGVAKGHDEFGFGEMYDHRPEVTRALEDLSSFVGLRELEDALLIMSVHPARKTDGTPVGAVIVGIDLTKGYFSELTSKYGVRMRMDRGDRTLISNADPDAVAGWDHYTVELTHGPEGLLVGHIFENNRVERERLIVLRNEMLLFLLGSSVVLLGVASVMVRRLIRPVAALATDMERYAGGDRTERPLPRAVAEFRRIVDTYAQMKRENTVLLETLEAKVRERTRDLEDKNRAILDSISYAKSIQYALLPPDELLRQPFEDSFVLWSPRDIVGGDIYFIKPMRQGTVVAVIDCTGHGVPGAFMTILAVEVLNTVIDHRPDGDVDLASVITELNTTIFTRVNAQRVRSGGSEIRDGMDMGLIYRPHGSRSFRFCGMGHGLFVRRGGAIVLEEIKGSRNGIGGGPSLSTVTVTEVEAGVADAFWLVTDGYHDQLGGPKGMPMGKRRMKEILAAHADRPMAAQRAALEEALAGWRGDRQRVDDVTVLGFRL